MSKNIQTQINELKNALKQQQNEITEWETTALELIEKNKKLKQEIKILEFVKLVQISKLLGYDIKLN